MTAPERDGAAAPPPAARTRAWVVPALVVLALAAAGRQYLGCPSYWYDEAYVLLNVFVFGSYRSAFRLAVTASSSFNDPPVATTFPLGRIVAFIWMRGWDIGGPVVQAGVAAERSMISVVAVAGLPPPKIITRGLYPFAGVSGRSTDVP